MTTNETTDTRTRDARVLKHMKTVESVARSVARRLPASQTQVEYEDLVSVGMLGLLRAFDRYEGDLERFDAVVEARARGAMVDELRRRDFFPRRLRAKAKKLKKAAQDLELRLGREASQEEMAAELGVSLEEWGRLRASVVPYSFVNSESLFDALKSKSKTPHEVWLERERRAELLAAMDTLSEREQIVLELRFVKGMGQRQIAEVFDLTEGRISQIKSKALKKLRHKLADWATTLD